jgi:hypothetical protein
MPPDEAHLIVALRRLQYHDRERSNPRLSVVRFLHTSSKQGRIESLESPSEIRFPDERLFYAPHAIILGIAGGARHSIGLLVGDIGRFVLRVIGDSGRIIRRLIGCVGAFIPRLVRRLNRRLILCRFHRFTFCNPRRRGRSSGQHVDFAIEPF